MANNCTDIGDGTKHSSLNWIFVVTHKYLVATGSNLANPRFINVASLSRDQITLAKYNILAEVLSRFLTRADA